MRNFNGLMLLIAASSLLFSACTEPSTVGVEVQPAGDKANVVFMDSLTLKASTVVEIPISVSQNSLNLVGAYNDPIFGPVAASCYLQFVLPTTSISFPSGTTVDSVILSLAYPTRVSTTTPLLYGDTTKAETIKVYQLKEQIYHDSTYKSNRVFAISSVDTVKSFTPYTGDTIPHLNIRLTNAIGQALIAAPTTDNASFTAAFNGLYLTATANDANGNGSIMYINPTGIQTKLSLYYNHGSKVDYVLTSSSSSRVNHFEHTSLTDPYTGSAEITKALRDSTVTGDDKVYIQSMSGVKTKIKIPYLQNLHKLGKITINKAELVLNVIPNNIKDDANYKLPSQLYAVGPDSVIVNVGSYPYKSSDDLIILDQQEGASYFGGAVNTGLTQYRINLARHLQKLLSNPNIKDYGLYIIAGSSAVTGNRVVLGGPKNPKYKMKLNITYTKL